MDAPKAFIPLEHMPARCIDCRFCSTIWGEERCFFHGEQCRLTYLPRCMPIKMRYSGKEGEYYRSGYNECLYDITDGEPHFEAMLLVPEYCVRCDGCALEYTQYEDGKEQYFTCAAFGKGDCGLVQLPRLKDTTKKESRAIAWRKRGYNACLQDLIRQTRQHRQWEEKVEEQEKRRTKL